MIHVLAIDLGASGGRVIRGSWDSDAKKVGLHEVRRFANEPVEVRGTLYWDILRLFHEIKAGIREAVLSLPPFESIAALAVDTWGVDFGLLDRNGVLMGNPVHYRDKRTNGLAALLGSELGEGTLFRATGIQDAWFNTVCQMKGALVMNPEAFENAAALLFTPDLINYFLTGIKAAERTISGTSQLLAAGKPLWAADLFERLDLPLSLMQRIVEPGTILGPVDADLARELGLEPGTPVAVVPSHDTESAALAVPAHPGPGESFAFVSCGTWSVIGAELPAPVLSESCRLAGFSNEAGADGTSCLLRNIMGMWLLQECKRWWERDGSKLEHGELVELAATAPPWRHHIDVNHALFAAPGDMPGRIAAYCIATAQDVPGTPAAVLRCIIESLACAFRHSLDELESLVGQRFDTLWLVGGGSRNVLLCTTSAAVCGRTVRTGPAETTALGNIMSQFMALGIFGSIDAARQAIAESFESSRFEPEQNEESADAYLRWRDIVEKAPAEL